MHEFAAITFVGPGDLERDRLVDLVESLTHYEPDVRFLVIIDDASGLAFEPLLNLPGTCRLVAIPNPRRGRGHWWSGGLATGLAAAFQWLAKHTSVEFAVRLDTDALVIAPFAKQVASCFSSDPQIGLLGTFSKYPTGENRDKPEQRQMMNHIVPKLMRPLTMWRHSSRPTRIQCLLLPRHRLVARLARHALANGYRPGDFVQGGGYAVSGELLKRAGQSGFVDDPLCYLAMYFSEDILATMLCYAVDLRVQDFNDPGEVFAVTSSELFAPPSAVNDMGYSIVHSVKSDKDGFEREVRQYFQRLRHRQG